MANIDRLEKALIAAHNAGDSDAARRLAPILKKAKQEEQEGLLLPGDDILGTFTPQEPPKEEPSVGEQVIGAGETALSVGTGVTGGTAGFIGGTLKGIAQEILEGNFGSPEAAQRIAKGAQEGAKALTFTPRTEAGQAQTEAVAEAASQLVPIAPLAAEAQVLGQSARAALPGIKSTVKTKLADPIQEGIRVTRERIKQRAAKNKVDGTGKSGGAAAVDIGDVRQELAQELPVPISLTKGQKTRSFEDQRFERETAKLPEEGAEFREKFSDQNLKLTQNLDEFIDATGAEETGLFAIGEIVHKTLRKRAAKDKTKIRSLYKEAEKAGEMEQPVTLGKLALLLENSKSAEAIAPIVGATKNELKRLGGVIEDAAGNLVIKEMSLFDSEQLRKFINKVTGNDPTNIKFASEFKQLIDEATENKGGKVYRQARRARAKYAKDYENAALTKALLGKKRGSEDRAIALEDFVRKITLAPATSLEQMRQVKRLLQTKSGTEGKQAWSEIQGGVLRHIRDEALKNVAPDQLGNRVMSPSQLDRVLTQLDKSGKLDFIFGKNGAEKLRVINDVAKDVLTSPAGVINNSNTATVLAGLLDVAVSGSTGIPAPVATSFRLITKNIKDKKLKARVKEHLGEP